jgi:hypothetical protein
MDVIDTGFAPRGIKRTTTPGGRALKFYASMRIEFQQISTVKGKVINVLTNEETDQVVSTNVKVKVVKNKVGAPFRECTVRVHLGKGFDNFWSAVQVLTAYKKITTGSGYYYFDKLPNLVHADMEESAKGKPYIRSEHVLLNFAKQNPDWAEELAKEARALLPSASLPTEEELLAFVNTPTVVEEATPLDLGEFGGGDSSVPNALGMMPLEDLPVSPDGQETVDGN